MDFNTRTRSITSLTKDVKNKKYDFNNPVQRMEGQWNNNMKSELLDSMLRSYPIDPLRGIKEDNVISIIDGKQRLTTIIDYVSDFFVLSKKLKPLVIDEEEFVIAGKKFSKLDEKLQDIINNYEMQVYVFTDCTYEDVQEMFRRQNGGRPLNAKQMRTSIFTRELNDRLNKLKNHPFMKKIVTRGHVKSATDRDLIIETLMLMETNDKNDFTSFRSGDINLFIEWYADNSEHDNMNMLMEALGRMDGVFEEDAFKKNKIPVTSIPMVLYSACRVIKDNKSFDRLAGIIRDFVSNYENNEEYKSHCKQGTSSQPSVRWRFDYWRKIVHDM